MLNAWCLETSPAWGEPAQPSTQHLNMSRKTAEDGGGRNGVPDRDSKGEEGVPECVCLHVCVCAWVCVCVLGCEGPTASLFLFLTTRCWL